LWNVNLQGKTKGLPKGGDASPIAKRSLKNLLLTVVKSNPGFIRNNPVFRSAFATHGIVMVTAWISYRTARTFLADKEILPRV
jgi:hypothetical protein